MERAKDDKRPLWRKTSSGTLTLRGPGMDPRRRIKPNQTLHATAEQLGGFINQFELVSDPGGQVTSEDLALSATKPEAAKAAGKPAPEPTKAPTKPSVEKYEVRHVGSGWYDVVSPEGKTMNDKKLRSTEADELKEELEAEGAK